MRTGPLIVVIVVVLALIGCGGESSERSADPAVSVPAEVVSPAVLAALESESTPTELAPPPDGVVLSEQGVAAWQTLALADEQAPLAPDFPAAPERLPATGGPGLLAKAWYVVDEDTGEVLTARNAELPLPVASISKLAAMLVWADAGVPDDQVVTITREIKEHMQITRSKLRVRGQYRAGDLIYSALLASDNRAAAALAFTTGLPNEAFAAAMTRRAHCMGLATATFGDPTGLHPENKVSPRDAVRLLAASLDHPVLGPVLRTIEHRYERQDRPVLIAARNSNLLAHYDHWRTSGGKTGYTVVAGSCLVQRVEIAGRPLLVALLGARHPDDRYEEMVRLRYWLEAQG